MQVKQPWKIWVNESRESTRSSWYSHNKTKQNKTWSYYIRYTRWHDDVIKWKHFPRHWTFVRGIHRWPVNSPHKSQWRGALMFSLIFAWINGWANNREAGDLRRHRAHYDVSVMEMREMSWCIKTILESSHCRDTVLPVRIGTPIMKIRLSHDSLIL